MAVCSFLLPIKIISFDKPVMDFKIRPTGSLLLTVCATAMFLILAGLHFFSPLYKSGLLRYTFVLDIIVVAMYIHLLYRDLYFVFSGKTMLSIDENHIHDFYNGVAYNWKDIAAIREEHGYLYLKLYHPEDYLDKIGNWYYRMIKKLRYKPGGKHNEFSINIGLADAGEVELSKLLQGYSKVKN